MFASLVVADQYTKLYLLDVCVFMFIVKTRLDGRFFQRKNEIVSFLSFISYLFKLFKKASAEKASAYWSDT